MEKVSKIVYSIFTYFYFAVTGKVAATFYKGIFLLPDIKKFSRN